MFQKSFEKIPNVILEELNAPKAQYVFASLLVWRLTSVTQKHALYVTQTIW